MTFVVVPSPFNIASKNPTAALQIEDWRDDGRKIPAGMISPEPGSNIDTEKLAKAMTDILNGVSAYDWFGVDGRVLHYHRLQSGVSFTHHFHDADGRSVSNSLPAALFTLGEEYRPRLFNMLNNNHALFESALMAGSRADRRGQSRRPAMEATQKAPKKSKAKKSGLKARP